MILPYQELMRRGSQGQLVEPFEPELVNPASIDIRIGDTLMENGKKINLTLWSEDNPYLLMPKDFVLVATKEILKVPLDCAMDFRLKSSRARAGYNHALAFWFDPGWWGVGTLELTNDNLMPLPLYPGLRIGQIIYHRLTEECSKPYHGRYQSAVTVEGVKHGN